MTKYTSNEQYELDKKKLMAEHFILGNINTFNMLKQSKWIGDPDNKPIPVVKDKAGKLTKDYSTLDWFNKLNEKLDEVKQSSDIPKQAEELQDLITVCTSFLEYLGYDETARGDLAKQINEKNRQRGYFEE